ncbi:DNase I-like protein [Aulographum hederae CBS 113979]|uniref:DNase I-like protein n=1 Tax=Aulographum hederae CBS 113979 TaxID=1176131 RepID=A0A6G1H0D4_9PEZI|nr:DNase I-like protein [Aulographum hederae CBS 113979]
MDRPEDNTDASSIKPVSSLRAKFENIASSKPPPPRPPSASSRQPSPSINPVPTEQDFSHSRLDGRISLDIPRNNPHRPSPPHSANPYYNAPLTPDPRMGRPPVSSHAKPRPMSMGPMSPPSPPQVVVDSPKSPPKFPRPEFGHGTGYSTPTRAKGADAQATMGQRAGSPTGNGISHFKNPSRAPTPAMEARQAPYLPSSSPSAATPDPQKQMQTPSDTPIKLPTAPLPNVPPPINRAGKPKAGAFQKGNTASNRQTSGASLAPEQGGEENERVSPFSTPPSSDETTPSEMPPHVPQLSKSRFTGAHPSLTSQGYFTPPAMNQHQGRSRDAMPQPKMPAPVGASQNRPPIARQNSDLPELRPGLPPRRENTQPEIQSAIEPRSSLQLARPEPRSAVEPRASRPPPPEPPVRRSMDPGARPSGPSIDNSRFMNPQRRTTQPEEQSSSNGFSAKISSRTSVDTRRDFPRNDQIATAWDGNDSDEAEGSMDRPGQILTDYPDSSQVNRRPPLFPRRPYEIGTEYNTKLFAVCGEYICTTGYVTKVWNVLSGELLLDTTHGETVKVTALAFKPATEVEDEGKRLWMGTNGGEIFELDIPSQQVVYVKSNAHARREVLKIYRHAADMWSLDDDGKLHVWPPDEKGEPNLAQTPHSFRVPKGHTFSLLAGSHLWLAIGKDIRIFHYEPSGNSFTQVLQILLAQPNVGEVTSGTTISSQPDRVYFGHIDGKVTIYSRKDYSCLGVVNVSLYRISSLVGVGDYLWAAYNTGMIYVYDTKCKPWVVKKDWKAHEATIAGVQVDRSSIWKMDRLQVASLGTDNIVRLWDGMMKDDWLEADMESHAEDFCDFRGVSAVVMTWNAGASKPTHLRADERDNNFFRELLQERNHPPDILVFGFQELVDLENKKVTAKSLFKRNKKKESEKYGHTETEHMSSQYRAWRDHLARCLDEYTPSNLSYTLLHTANLIGLFTCVFVKSTERQRIRDVNAAQVKLGLGGMHGNKGALIVRFILDDSSLCFVNCHLAAGQGQTQHRNNDIASILESSPLPRNDDSSARADMFVSGGDGSMILDHEICILNGDLNYRIDTMTRDAVVRAVQENNLGKLLERDQLLLSRKRNPGFRLRAFNEAQITFAPTYKYDVGTDRYDSSEKKRSPAWCDRLLWRGKNRVQQLEYRRHEIRVSDHRPVSGTFELRIKTIDRRRRGVVWDECERRFEEVKMRIAMNTKLDYLTNVFGLSAAEAQRLLKGR